MRDLLGGALAHGYRRDRWTSQRIVEVIVRKFGVRYSRAHISRLLARNGWDARAHARQAGVRDEAARERWNRAVRRVRGKRLR
jgi:transposase